jgi:hypothetical protein
VHVYTPFKSGHLDRTIRVTRVVTGGCWGGALAVPQPGAWRCFSGRHIYDPCFSRPGGGSASVFCPTSYPWVKRVVRLKLTDSLPRHFGNRPGPTVHGLPWAIQTTTGKNCLVLTGASTFVGDRRVNYACKGGGGLVGSPRKSTALWTIRYVRRVKSGAVSWAGIRHAWW